MAHFYTGQLRLARLCVLRSLMKRPSVLFLRRAAPYKGFALALLRIYLYDDKAVIALNYKDGTKTVFFNDMECALSQRASIPGSDLEILSPPKSPYSNFSNQKNLIRLDKDFYYVQKKGHIQRVSGCGP